MMHIDQCKASNFASLYHEIKELLYYRAMNLTVDNLQVHQLVRDKFVENPLEFCHSQTVQFIVSVDDRFEVFYFCETFKNGCHTIPTDATIVE